MPYKAPKLRLKKRKTEGKMKKAEMDGSSVEEGGKLKLAKMPKKKEGKIIRIKSKPKKTGAGQMKMMRKDYERETDATGRLMMEKQKYKKEKALEKFIKGL